jgi:hypothetical protein
MDPALDIPDSGESQHSATAIDHQHRGRGATGPAKS